MEELKKNIKILGQLTLSGRISEEEIAAISFVVGFAVADQDNEPELSDIFHRPDAY